MKKIYKNKLFRTVVVVALLAATHTLWLPLPARFLVLRDNLEKADAIVVLSGSYHFGRENKAVEVYKKGFAKNIVRMLEKNDPQWFEVMAPLFNMKIIQRDVYKKYFGSKGVPLDAVILGDNVATSTFDELKAAKDLIIKNNFKSIILITTVYHMRRTVMTAEFLFKSSGIRIYHSSSDAEIYHPNRWWLYEDDIKYVTMEYLSILLYVTYHFTTGK